MLLSTVVSKIDFLKLETKLDVIFKAPDYTNKANVAAHDGQQRQKYVVYFIMRSRRSSSTHKEWYFVQSAFFRRWYTNSRQNATAKDSTDSISVRRKSCANACNVFLREKILISEILVLKTHETFDCAQIEMYTTCENIYYNISTDFESHVNRLLKTCTPAKCVQLATLISVCGHVT